MEFKKVECEVSIVARYKWKCPKCGKEFEEHIGLSPSESFADCGLDVGPCCDEFYSLFF
jgi:hypothetical protein